MSVRYTLLEWGLNPCRASIETVDRLTMNPGLRSEGWRIPTDLELQFEIAQNPDDFPADTYWTSVSTELPVTLDQLRVIISETGESTRSSSGLSTLRLVRFAKMTIGN